MQPESDGCLRFHRSRRLDGSIESVSVGKRNGKSSLFFHPSWTEPPEAALNSLEVGDPERYSVNLNPIERETWRRIRQGDSIACIANDDGVARSAIYAASAVTAKARVG
jgi:hypothetical protein